MSEKLTVLGIHYEGMDPSAALIVDGEIRSYAEEERFNRKKHADWLFPSQAVAFCLRQAGLTLSDVDVIASGWDAQRFPDEMEAFYRASRLRYPFYSESVLAWQEENLVRYDPRNLMAVLRSELAIEDGAALPEVRFLNHHFCHACSAYMVSGFDTAAILTADGHGEDDAVNFWRAQGGKITHLKRWLLPHSLGWFYTKFTEWFGFRKHDGEGKLMGLAAYGKPDDELAEKVRKVLHLTGRDDVFEVDAKFFYDTFEEAGPYTREWLDLFGPPRALESREPFDAYHKDLAYAVQHVFEEAMVGLVDAILDVTQCATLCVAGGSFMNCKMNGALARKVGLGNFFVQPIAGDNGISLGAAMAACQQEGIAIRGSYNNLYFGPEYNNREIEAALVDAGLAYERSDNIARDAARELADSKVVGWFQGRLEGGARALGGRSILGSPIDPEMKEIINRTVKFREPWRPFCPSALTEDAPEYFDYDASVEMPFMIVACDARPGVKDLLPSVVHVDNTVRLQSVRQDVNPLYYALIQEYKALTGHGVILNTSFNVKGEPIVCTPENAVNCFLKTGMQALAIGDFLVRKEGQP